MQFGVRQAGKECFVKAEKLIQNFNIFNLNYIYTLSILYFNIKIIVN